MKNYKQIFYSLPLSALILERCEGKYFIKDLNIAFTNALCKNKGDLIGKIISEIFYENPDQHGTNWEQIYPSLEKVYISGEADSIKLLRYDILNEEIGEFVERYWQIENIPIKNKLSGKVQFIQSIIIEKTSEVLGRKMRQDLENKLFEIGEKEKHFVERNTDGLYSLDLEGKFLSVNQGLVDISETPEEKLLNMSFLPFCAPHHKQKIMEFFKKALQGENQDFEADFISSNGREMILNIFIVPFKIQEEIAGVYGIARDITKLKDSESSRIKSEKKHRAMIQEGFDLISILDSKGNFQFVSGASLDQFGVSPEEFIGKNCFHSIHPEDKVEIMKNFSELKLKKQVQTEPYRYQDINGKWRWIETKAMNLLNDPDVEGIVTNSREVTELIQVSKERDQIYQRYKLAAAATKDLIYDWNIKTNKILRFSKGSNTVFGYPAEIFENNNFWKNHIHPEEIEELKKILHESLRDPEIHLISTRYRLRQANGTYAHIIDRGNIVRNKNGKAVRIVGAMTDISEIAKSKEDLKIANMRFRYAMKATKEMIWDWDIVNDHILRGNSFHKLYGYNSDEKPSGLNFWFSKICENDKDEVVTSIQLALKNVNTKKWKKEYCFRKENGEKAYVVDRGYILRDGTGKAVRMLGAVLDITESKRLLNRVESQNKILREVAWEQSHIVRAPLARLKALFGLLEEELYEEWDREQLLRLINDAADELDDIIAKIIKKTEGIGIH